MLNAKMMVARSQSAVEWSKMTSQLSSTYDVTAHIDSREINILDLLLIQLQHVLNHFQSQISFTFMLAKNVQKIH